MTGSATRVDTQRSSTSADTAGSATRVDMHCHSTASQMSKLGVQRALGLPECATPPEEVYELAKRRGMDFVTITDHDTIDGALAICDRPDVFISEELTAHFRGEPQAVHVLCYGITPEDHEWLQANSSDVELCAMYLYDQEIACALAHPYYAVGAPLTGRHRRRLAELFGIWETRNGARARELNRPAAMYVATLDGTGIGGSDDHAGVDIGRTWTEAPPASTPGEFLEHMRAGRVSAKGKQGSAAKWAHAAIALAARSLGRDEGDTDAGAPDPRRVMTMMQRLLREGDARQGSTGTDLAPADARCLLRAWLSAVELDHLDTLTATGEHGLIAYMQEDGFSHSDLYRRACRLHERKLRDAVRYAVGVATGNVETGDGAQPATVETDAAQPATIDTNAVQMATGETDLLAARDAEVGAAAAGLFESCIAAIPYAPATAFLASEQAKLDPRREDGELPRVAILVDGIGSTHGVTRTIQEIRQRGVPGFEIEVVATDADVDRRLSAVTEFDVPFYPGLKIGVPSLSAAAQTLTEGFFDAIHVCSPGPAGIAGALLAHALGLPLIGSYHTELTAYAQLRSGEQRVVETMSMAVGVFYNACDLVLSPSPASDEALASIGMAPEKVLRWDRGVDTSRFDPSLRDAVLAEGWSRDDAGQSIPADVRSDAPGGPVNVLYAGRITREKGAELLADAFLAARERDPRLRLVLAGGGPEQERLRERVGEHATFLGWLHGAELAEAYASADVFLFPSATDTFGQVILEAQASGLPVLAVAAGGPLALVQDRVTGLLCEADSEQLADALVELAGSPLLRERLAAAALSVVRERTWEQALERLADGYSRALAGAGRSSLDTDRLVA
ncbi:MAG TPA: glycosyltransferase [Solirubrobacteraceae bacterium]|jgi:glycosyltransferase involved in cell wall biosynthesis/predicted metal-dependent phosphoesterase TrpH|nr:glycosyltransferase [Solirubrobacteraceae bacterium]